MSHAEPSSLIPIEQGFVPFHHKEILGLRFSENRLAGGMSSMCAMVGLVPEKQVQRIRRDAALAPYLFLAIVETPGGPQRMDVLLVEAIPLWLSGINLTRIAPAKRPLILALKREVVEVLRRYFFQTDAQLASPAAPAREALPDPHASPRSRRPMPASQPTQAKRARPSTASREALTEEQREARIQAAVQPVRQALEARLLEQSAAFEAYRAEVGAQLADLKHQLAAHEGVSQASAGPAPQQGVAWPDLEEVIEAVGELGVALDQMNTRRQQGQQAVTAQLGALAATLGALRDEMRTRSAAEQAQIAALADAWARLYQQVARMDPDLTEVKQTLSELIAKGLATLSNLGTTERLVAAIVAELLEIKERMNHLEAQPPSQRSQGWPRKDRQP